MLQFPAPLFPAPINLYEKVTTLSASSILTGLSIKRTIQSDEHTFGSQSQCTRGGTEKEHAVHPRYSNEFDDMYVSHL